MHAVAAAVSMTHALLFLCPVIKENMLLESQWKFMAESGARVKRVSSVRCGFRTDVVN